MSYRKILAFNNFAGVCFIKITKNNEWKDSKIFRIYGFLKTFLVICGLSAFIFSKEFKAKMFNKEAVELNQYSKFSRIILQVAVQCFYLCGIVITFIQYFRRKQVMLFLKAITEFDLSKSSKIKLVKSCITSLIINIGITAITVLIRNLKILKNDYLPSYILWFLSTQLYLILTAIFAFFCNFQEFIIIALKEVEENIHDSFCDLKSFENSLINLIKIENFLEVFERNFAFQLTIVAVNYVFSIVTFVSFIIF